MCSFQSIFRAQWLSWLERRPVTAEVESSSLFWVVNGKYFCYGILAQLGEHLPYKQGVTGSSPVGPILKLYHTKCDSNFEFYREKCLHFEREGAARKRNRIMCFAQDEKKRTLVRRADVAQLAEQLICNQQVIGSSPIIGLNFSFVLPGFRLFTLYGWVPEWPKGADCKSVGNAFEGSNPSPPIFVYRGVEQSGSSSGS